MTAVDRVATTGAAGRIAERPTLCIVLHDVAPATWAGCRTVLEALDGISWALGRGRMPVTLLAVPRYHGGGRDASFERWLRERAAGGDEVALHGYTHRDDATAARGSRPSGAVDRLRRNVYTRGEGEFWALDAAEAGRRIDAGLAWLRELGLPPSGFIAPAWLLGPGAWEALRQHDFDYTCTVRRLHLLKTGTERIAQAQVYSTSSAWRRQMSLVWNATLAALQHRDPIARLELHPSDLAPAIRSSWEGLARRQAARRRVCTLATLARELSIPAT